MTRNQKIAKGFFAAWCAANIVAVPASQIATMQPAKADIPIVSRTYTLTTATTGTTTALTLTGQSICWVATNAASTLSGGGVIIPQVSSNGGNDWQTASTVSGGSLTLAAGAVVGIGNIAVLGATNFRLNVSGTVSGTGSVTYGCTPSVGGLTFNGTVGISGTVPVSGSVSILGGRTTTFLTSGSASGCTSITGATTRLWSITNSGPQTTVFPAFYQDAATGCAISTAFLGDALTVVLGAGQTINYTGGLPLSGIAYKLSGPLSASGNIILVTGPQ